MKMNVTGMLFLAIFVFITFSAGAEDVSTHPIDSVTLTWDKEKFPVLQYEIWIDSSMDQAIYGRSDSAMVGVPQGTHCFKMRKMDHLGRHSEFSYPICLKTKDLMEIHISFDQEYI